MPRSADLHPEAVVCNPFVIPGEPLFRRDRLL